MPATVFINPNVEAQKLSDPNNSKRSPSSAKILTVLNNTRKAPLQLDELLASSFGPTAKASAQATSTQTNRPVHPDRHGFINAVVRAYNHHHHLSVRPDDVWLTILSQFSLYVNAHAEEMRHRFVNHAGQERLTVTRGGNRFAAQYDGIIEDFDRQIKSKLKDADMYEWLKPAFSTTTPVDAIAASISLMAIVSKYFSYGIGFMCGVPSMTLEGTVQDWIELKAKAERLTSFDKPELTRWYHLLVPVFDHFIRAFAAENHEADIEGFWKHMVKYDGMSGGPYIDGWISYFSAFDEDGKWHLHGGPKTNMGGRLHAEEAIWFNWLGPDAAEWWNPRLELASVPSGSVEVEVEIDDNGEKIDGRLLAGLMGWEWDAKKKQISPHVGWAVYSVEGGDGKSNNKRRSKGLSGSEELRTPTPDELPKLAGESDNGKKRRSWKALFRF